MPDMRVSPLRSSPGPIFPTLKSGNTRDFIKKSWKIGKRAWGFVRLKKPKVFIKQAEALKEMGREFAFFNFKDKDTFVNWFLLETAGITRLLPEIFGHEIGHHVRIPSDPPTHAILLAPILKWLGAFRHNIGSLELKRFVNEAKLIENLFSDTLINGVLHSNGFRMLELYSKLFDPSIKMKIDQALQLPPRTDYSLSPLWQLYLRSYEKLWDLDPGTLVRNISHKVERDADGINSIVRGIRSKYDWIKAIVAYAEIIHKYYYEEAAEEGNMLDFFGQQSYIPGGKPGKEIRFAPGEGDIEGDLRGLVEEAGDPLNYKKIIEALGLNPRKADIWYYRDLASKNTVKFPPVPQRSGDLVPEGLEIWDVDDPVESLDIVESFTAGIVFIKRGKEVVPAILPGITALKRIYSEGIQDNPGTIRPNLKIVLDMSGSMVTPDQERSFAVESAFILAESALNVGMLVSVTIFDDDYRTLEFTRDRDKIGEYLVTYFGGRTTYPGREVIRTSAPYAGRPTHLVIITDMELNNMDEAIEDMDKALKVAGGGGVLYLIKRSWIYGSKIKDPTLSKIRKVGYKVVPVTKEQDLRNLSAEQAQEIFGGGVVGGSIDPFGSLHHLMPKKDI